MGNATSKPGSDRQSKERSAEIDRVLEAAKKRQGNPLQECKVLVLGAPGTGKSTLVKQVKLMHLGGFGDADEKKEHYGRVVQRNVVEAARTLAEYLRAGDIECADEDNQDLLDRLLAYELPTTRYTCIPFDIQHAAARLWVDPACTTVLEEHFYELGLVEPARYFFSEVGRIGAPEYVPTDEDILRAQEHSVGVEETRFKVANLNIHMFDVGVQRGDPRKWIHCFENVDSVFFCLALSDYDQVIPGAEDPAHNRLEGSLLLFESVVNSAWFRRSSVSLFLNKIDVFEEKLARIPMKHFFSDFTGGADVEKATEYIIARCKRANRAGVKVYPYKTQLIDTSATKAVFGQVQETITRDVVSTSPPTW